jgi:hypothetical protein
MARKRLAHVICVNTTRFSVKTATSVDEYEFWVNLSCRRGDARGNAGNSFEHVSHMALLLLPNKPDYVA